MLRRFGVPQRIGEAFTDWFLGRQGASDRFVVDHLCVHFQYIETGERIGLVAIMLAESVP